MQWAPDGGKNSGVMGFFLVEIKSLFSVVILRFNHGSREAFHSHAFNALTWWLKGKVNEIRIPNLKFPQIVHIKQFWPSWKPKVTKRNNMHRVESCGTSWALSLRGPWWNRWYEIKNGRLYTLTHGREEV